MVIPQSANRLLFSTQNRRKTNHSNHRRQKRIWFADQPPAESVGELLDNICDGSIFQYLAIYPDGCQRCWNLTVRRQDGVNGLADVWDVNLGQQKRMPLITYRITRGEIAGVVRNLFRVSMRCQMQLPVERGRMVSPAAVEALAAAEALAEVIRR